jgi:hypothetical protein
MVDQPLAIAAVDLPTDQELDCGQAGPLDRLRCIQDPTGGREFE